MEFKKLIEKFKERKIALLYDDTSPINRSVLTSPSLSINPDIINEICTLAEGLFFVAMTKKRCEEFSLKPMSSQAVNKSFQSRLNLYESIDARHNVSTGISAYDRYEVLKIIGSDTIDSKKLVRPGHVFPFAIQSGGVLARHSIPEGSFDLTKLTFNEPASLFVDILGNQGKYLNFKEIDETSKTHNIPVFPLSSITEHRLQNETLITRETETTLPTKIAKEFKTYAYRSIHHLGDHLAFIQGDPKNEDSTLVRVQSESTVSDVFGGPKSNSRLNIQKSLKAISENRSGVLVYLRKPQTGYLAKEILAESSVYPEKATTMRGFGIGAQILRDIGVKKIRLLSNSRTKLTGLETFGLEIVEKIPF